MSNNSNKGTRTRFAPSPTGYMHVGNLRTALYAYLMAKKDGGSFILRIEDTDQGRLVEGATDIIYSTLKQAGLNWDEGPDIGGPYAPYIQSERKGNYIEYAKKLVADEQAYYCFCTKEEQEQRAKEDGDSVVSRYDGHCRHMDKSEVEKKLQSGIPFVIRQMTPNVGNTTFVDAVYGMISVENDELEDQVLIKSDLMPTYNFANVVDDHDMGITCVIRGNEYLSSTPKYNLLYHSFGWEVPTYIHCPPVMKDAQNKLSKRNGDASYNDLIEKGYLPEAVINYLALLGWSPSGEQEIFSLSELIEAFGISGISKSPSIFDPEKLKHINSEYIKALPLEKFTQYATPFIKTTVKSDINYSVICEALQPRTEFFADIPEKLLFIDDLPDYDIALFNNKKMKTNPETAKLAIENMLPMLKELDDYSKDGLHKALFELIASLEVKNGYILWPLRVALSGVETTPGGGIELAATLGKKATIERLEKALTKL